uniref:Lipoxygenase domain-containing protein n=1 Tax=Oryza nivara TaxID=4536 RepID=A0A0E0G593_ORYNI
MPLEFYKIRTVSLPSLFPSINFPSRLLLPFSRLPLCISLCIFRNACAKPSRAGRMSVHGEEDGWGGRVVHTKDRAWWPEMTTVTVAPSSGSRLAALVKSCITIVWIASALHVAVNSGQYPYGGFSPNRPMAHHRQMPERGTEEYTELERRPDAAFIRTITGQLRTLLGISLIEILSKHSDDEVYLGQRDTPEWTLDTATEAFRRFGDRLVGIEARIAEMNRVTGTRATGIARTRRGSPTRCCPPRPQHLRRLPQATSAGASQVRPPPCHRSISLNGSPHTKSLHHRIFLAEENPFP